MHYIELKDVCRSCPSGRETAGVISRHGAGYLGQKERSISEGRDQAGNQANKNKIEYQHEIRYNDRMEYGNRTAYDGRFSGSMEARLESGETAQIREIYYGTQESSILLWKENQCTHKPWRKRNGTDDII